MLAYAQTQWMIVDETSDEDDEETPPLGLTPAMSRGGMAATDSDVVVGGETSSEGELSGDDASEVGETTSGGGDRSGNDPGHNLRDADADVRRRRC